MLGLAPVKKGVKESIHLTTSAKKKSSAYRPESRTQLTGLSKFPKKGLASLDKIMGSYRRDLLSVAKEKYLKTKKSFKKKTRPAHSRRNKK